MLQDIKKSGQHIQTETELLIQKGTKSCLTVLFSKAINSYTYHSHLTKLKSKINFRLCYFFSVLI